MVQFSKHLINKLLLIEFNIAPINNVKMLRLQNNNQNISELLKYLNKIIMFSNKSLKPNYTGDIK